MKSLNGEKMDKVAVIGAGALGTALAQTVAEKNISDARATAENLYKQKYERRKTKWQ